MIIVRVGPSNESDQHSSPLTKRTRSWISAVPRMIRRQDEDSTFHMHNIAVEITEVVYRDPDTTPTRDVKSPPGISPEPEPGMESTPESELRSAAVSKHPGSHDRDANSVDIADAV